MKKHSNGQGKGRVTSDRDKRLKMKVASRPIVKPMSVEWWVGQSRLHDGGSCPKCGGPTAGHYIPPSRGTMNECAAVEKCRICGWEHVHLTGMSGIPYQTQPTRLRSALKPVGTIVGTGKEKNPPRMKGTDL